MTEKMVQITMPYDAWRALMAERLKDCPNLILLYGAGWRAGFMVNGMQP
jgi:hypothetical protein